MPTREKDAPAALCPYRVREVLNYGGFFGGDTVTLIADPFDTPGEDAEFTIADHDFENLRDKHQVVVGVALGLTVEGGEVRRARILGAPTRDALYAAAEVAATGTGPTRLRAYRCPRCELWIEGAPAGVAEGAVPTCRLCGQPLR